VQIKDYFLNGFNQVLPFKAFDFLQPDELCALISGDSKPWTDEEIRANITFKGFRSSSPTRGWLTTIILQMPPALQSNLLRFITGKRRLPNGGLEAFNPNITVIRLSPDDSNYSDSPIAVTTAHQLKIPEYGSQDDLFHKLMEVISAPNV
jgi:hypothetical protein